MPQIKVLEWSLEQLIDSRLGGGPDLNYVPIPQLPIVVVVDVDQADFDVIKRDPLLNQIMREVFQDTLVQAVRNNLLPRLTRLDLLAASSTLEAYAEVRNREHEAMEHDIDAGIAAGELALQQRLQTLQMQKKIYKKYRMKVVKRSVQFGAAAGAAGVGLGAGVVTGGASLPIAIIGLYRAVMDGVKLIRDCWLEAESCEENVRGGLQALRATYAGGQGRGRARELGASTFNAVTKWPFRTRFSKDPSTNGTTVSDENKLWKGKLTHLRYLAHELSKDLNELLLKSDELDKLLTSKPGKKGYQKKLKSLHKDVHLLLERGFYVPSMAKRIRIDSAHQRADKGLAVQPRVESALQDFIQSRGGWVDRLDFAIGMIVDLGLAGAGYGVGGAPESVLDKVDLAIEAPVDTINMLYEVGKEYDAKGKARGLRGRIKQFVNQKRGKYSQPPRGA